MDLGKLHLSSSNLNSDFSIFPLSDQSGKRFPENPENENLENVEFGELEEIDFSNFGQTLDQAYRDGDLANLKNGFPDQPELENLNYNSETRQIYFFNNFSKKKPKTKNS